MHGMGIGIFFALIFYIGLPSLVLYFIIKLAIKNAIKELKGEGII